MLGIDLDKNCNNTRILEAFANNPKVISVKSDFELSTEGENKLVVYTNSYISNMEIKNVADSVNCKAVFVERDYFFILV